MIRPCPWCSLNPKQSSSRKNTGAINAFLKKDLVQGHLPSFLAELVDRISVLIFYDATLIFHKLLRKVYAIAILSTMLLSDSIFGCGNMACHEQDRKLEHHIASDIIQFYYGLWPGLGLGRGLNTAGYGGGLVQLVGATS